MSRRRVLSAALDEGPAVCCDHGPGAVQPCFGAGRGIWCWSSFIPRGIVCRRPLARMAAVLTELIHLDHELRLAVAAWRRSGSTLRHSADSALPNPLERWAPLRDAKTYRRLVERRDDPLADALAPWVHALYLERALWPLRAELAGWWNCPLRQLDDHDSAPPTPRELRRRMLCSPDPSRRQQGAAGLAAHAAEGGARSLAVVAESLEAERDLLREPSAQLAVAELAKVQGPSSAGGVAERLLARTDAMVPRLEPRSWAAALYASLAVDATEGWPARLTSSWVGDVFRGTVLRRWLPPDVGMLPAPRGATSFARALGAFGVGLLDDARERASCFATHQHPFGARRHERYGLFAAITGETSFARRVLGLSGEGVRQHRRALAAALLRTLRTEAWRVATGEAVRTASPEEAADTFVKVGERALGASPPRRLLGIVPELRPTDGAVLVGYVLAAQRRLEMLERFDEDWFRNPRAAEWLLDDDASHRFDVRLEPEQLDLALGACLAALAEALR